MNFKIFQIVSTRNLTQKANEFFNALQTTEIYKGDHRLSYCITSDVEFYGDLIVGSFTQEYIPTDVEVDTNRVPHPLDNVEPYLRTLFAIDLVDCQHLVRQIY